MYLSKCSQNPSLTARTINIPQHVLTKAIPFQLGHKMYLNMFCTNPTHASDDTNCISTLIYQFSPMSARTQNLSQHVLTKPNPCQRGLKMYLSMC